MATEFNFSKHTYIAAIDGSSYRKGSIILVDDDRSDHPSPHFTEFNFYEIQIESPHPTSRCGVKSETGWRLVSIEAKTVGFSEFVSGYAVEAAVRVVGKFFNNRSDPKCGNHPKDQSVLCCLVQSLPPALL
jgi:hypothetical protein